MDVGGAKGSGSFKDFLEALEKKEKESEDSAWRPQSMLDVVLQKHNLVQRLSQQCLR